MVADGAGGSPSDVLVVLADAVVLAGDAIDARVAEDKVVGVGDSSRRAGDGSGRSRSRAGDRSGRTGCASSAP